jgi:hypothetical protein
VETALRREDAWRTDGPLLPVEFARVTKLEQVKIVLVPGVPEVPTLWNLFTTPDLDQARQSLGKREGIPEERLAEWIGHWAGGEPRNSVEAAIASWVKQRGFDAAVWINLPPRWGGQSGIVPTQAQVLAHLEKLQGQEKIIPERYIRMTPRQVRTPYRSAIESTLGWTPVGRV